MFIDRYSGTAGHSAANTFYPLTECGRAIIGHGIEYYRSAGYKYLIYSLQNLFHVTAVSAYEYGIGGRIQIGINLHEISYHAVYAGSAEAAAVGKQQVAALRAFLKGGYIQVRKLQAGLDGY